MTNLSSFAPILLVPRSKCCSEHSKEIKKCFTKKKNSPTTAPTVVAAPGPGLFWIEFPQTTGYRVLLVSVSEMPIH